MEYFKPNSQRAKNAIILIWIVLLLEIISLVSGYFQYNLIKIVADGGMISPSKANANDTREQFIGIVSLIAFVISAFTFIQWFRRAYYNLYLTDVNLSQTENWAALSWFVPIVCLYRPYQMMGELYNKTKEFLSKNGFEMNGLLSTGYLGWWWGLWVINNFMGQIVFRYTLNAKSVEEIMNYTVLGMISNIIGIPLALTAIKVIKDYSNVEHLLNEIKDEENTDEEFTQTAIE